MLETVTQKSERYCWIDVVNPTKEDLEKLGAQYGLHYTSLMDCLDPTHLPKYERFGKITFIITRAYDENSTPASDTVQELTRKIALFIGEHFLITIHRVEQPFLTALKAKWHDHAIARQKTSAPILWDVLRAIALSYEAPITECLLSAEKLETGLFIQDQFQSRTIKDLYFLKRKASVFKRMLRMTIDILTQFDHFSAEDAPLFTDLKETSQRMYFYADELHEHSASLLNHYISLSSYRTNEIMRVLTLFSVFFLPLTFIVGVYGMNFKFMPELDWVYGYPVIIGVMCVVCLSILAWFRKKGWLG